MSNESLMAMMDTLLKQASHAEKRALSDISGPEPTTHSVMSADSGTKPATQGARSAENEADIKEEFGDVLAVTGQEDAESASSFEKDEADDIGTQTSDADEMRGNVQQPKATKDAPPDSGPGDETFSEKYSAASVVASGNRLLALLSRLPGLNKSAEGEEEEEEGEEGEEGESAEAESAEGESAEAEAAEGEEEGEEEEKAASVKRASSREKRAAAEKYREDAEAGYVAAKMITEQLLNKQAEEKEAIALAENIIKTAHADAETLCEFLDSHEKGTKAMHAVKKAALRKRGMPEEALPVMGEGGELAPEEGAMIPPEILAAGAPEGGEMGVETGGGGGDEEAAIDALADALAEAGVTPEELAQTIAEVGNEEGAPAGVPEELGGGMEEESGGPVEGEPVVEEEAAEEVPEEPKSATYRRAKQIKRALLNIARS